LYLNYEHERLHLFIGYYKSRKFISPKGNEMFQSFSQKSNVHYLNGIPDRRFEELTEPDRNLIFSRFFYEKYIDNNIKIGLQFEGYYQLNDSQGLPSFLKSKKGQFDCSFGIYMLFHDVFKI